MRKPGNRRPGDVAGGVLEAQPWLREARPAAPGRSPAIGLWKRSLSLLPLVFALGGLAIVWHLLAQNHWREITQAFSVAWLGILAVIVCHALPLLLDTVSWLVLFPKGSSPGLGKLLWVRWLGESVSNLMPAASLGGDLVRTRWAAAPGVPMLVSGATVVVNITIGFVTQIGFTILGVAVLAWTTEAGFDASASVPVAVVSLLTAGSFYALQHLGAFRLLRAITLPVAGAAWLETLLAKGERIDLAIQRVYAHRAAVLRCFAWSAAYWLTGSLEVWLAMHALGCGSWPKALILEAAVQGVRSGTFFLPGGLGAQEGGYVLTGSLIGVPAEAALALSLIRRIRELALGLPGLFVWQILEFRRRAVPATPVPEPTPEERRRPAAGWLHKHPEGWVLEPQVEPAHEGQAELRHPL